MKLKDYIELNLTFHRDSGHGWVEIHSLYLEELCIADSISCYSYRGYNGEVYLEEDCDAGVLIDALKLNNIKYRLIDKYQGESFVRSLTRYSK